ncbi:MAG: NrsF family protein [Gammaproteobacteria bacterium]
MNTPRDENGHERLIASLVENLAPVRRRVPVLLPTLTWLVLASAFIGACYAVVQPFRPGVLTDLAGAPGFAFETLLGLLAAAALFAAALALAVPALGSPWRRLAPALALGAAWLALQLWSLVEPTLTPTMLGKRAGCVWEVLIVGLPPLGAGLVLARRRWPLHGAASGLVCGLAAGLLAAAVMQLACMYVPLHNLLFHALPGLALGVLGALIGGRLLRAR